MGSYSLWENEVVDTNNIIFTLPSEIYHDIARYFTSTHTLHESINFGHKASSLEIYAQVRVLIRERNPH